MSPPRRGPLRKYLAIAGNIGSGKSSLVAFLCRRYDLQPFFEPNDDNPYLADFYADMKRWAFHSQMYFLTQKFRLHLEMDRARSRVPVVQDRTIYEDAEIFALNLYRRRAMTKRDYGLYRSFYEAALEVLRPPDLLIYLRAPLRTVRRRIKLRGRAEEQDVPASYLRRLQERYEEWFGRYDLSPTLTIDTGAVDYLTDLVDQLDLIAAIESHLE